MYFLFHILNGKKHDDAGTGAQVSDTTKFNVVTKADPKKFFSCYRISNLDVALFKTTAVPCSTYTNC